jgi:outer membrane autotransporter protein
VDLDTSGGDEIDSLQVGVYGNYTIEEFFVHFGVQGGFQEHDVKRPVLSSGVMRHGTADPDGSLLGAYVGIGHDFPIDENWTLQPNGQIAYLHQNQDSYKDSVGLRIDEMDTDTLRLGPTLEIHGQFPGDSVSIMPRGYLGFESRLALDDREADVRFSDGTKGTVSLDDDPDHFVKLGGGVDAVFANGVEVFVDFDGGLSDNETYYSGFVGFRIKL